VEGFALSQKIFDLLQELAMRKIPKRFQDFKSKYREIAKAYEELGTACHSAGPLDDKTRALVKLAISIGARIEGAAHSHVRKALDAGATKEELYHVALLAIQTIGFPPSMAAMSWIDDIVKPEAALRKKK
jgi:4-carboxymuconolactone decarboxylase